MTRFPTFLSCALICAALPALAQDNQLYQDPADPDASFVRIVAPDETLAVVAGKTFDAVEGGMTPYVMVMAGPVSVAVGDLAGEGEIEPASFYTFVRGVDGGLHMVQDAITNSPAQADLVFYNLSDLPLVDLFVPSVNAMAMEEIAQNTSRQVTLKAPLTLDFEIRDDSATLASVTALKMRRRAGATVIFSGSAGNYSAYSAENLYAN
ncbi:alginate O-acetyltransferase AlgF [Frigidibacter sp.]|uniref:alginate O-acetyltransferase AlgF n=1 Tax=Frigidibacter sp. TaxID=2586418 RepID=UPI002735B812|nr:alginate O-acetyltransferase AlgF [Frigidibacter sp.]MDP3342285.1 alginate O-acetyltransferase AlgF [Frigidibacter sp.]